MKKVLITSGGYFPGKNFGGPIVSLGNFVEVCGEDFEIYIITRNHDLNETHPYKNIHDGWNKVGKAKVKYFPDSKMNFKEINKIYKEIQPDLIYQSSFFSFQLLFPILRISKRTKQKVLIAPRGELLKNALNQKKIKKLIYIYLVKKLFIRGNISFQATSNDESKSIKEYLSVNDNQIFMLDNFPTTPNQKQKKKEKDLLKLMYLGRIHPTKNLHFALECLKEVKGKVEYDIYGNIENISYWNKCKTLIDELPDNIQVNYCGVVSRTDINTIFHSYDAMFLPTLTENYGHSIVESMLSGCPVIISNNTPWSEINEYGAGWAISLSNKFKFIETIEHLVVLDEERYNEILLKNKDFISVYFNIPQLKEKYLTSIKRILS